MVAIVLGATGLVGNEILTKLLADTRFEKVFTITRKPLPAKVSSDKYQNICTPDPMLDGEKNILLQYRIQISDALAEVQKNKIIVYCAIGTTIKTAGTRSKFYEVDHDLVMAFATLFKKMEIPNFWLISAAGADVNSSIFYNHVKGETEVDIKDLQFPSAGIVRPSLLLGDRQEFRTGEKFATIVSAFLNPLFVGPLKKVKPIQASAVANCMIERSLEKIKTSPQKDPHFEFVENNIIHNYT